MVCELYFKLYKSMERSKKKIETINNFMTWGHAPLTFLYIPFHFLCIYIHILLSRVHIHIHILLHIFIYACVKFSPFSIVL